MSLQLYQEKSLPLVERPRVTIAVAAGKGGVGKSTVAVTLARALKNKGFSVGVLDADVYGPSVRKMMKEERLPRKNGERIIPAFSDGIALMSLAFFRKDDEAASVRAPIANGIITQFINQVEWGPLDWLIIDFPPGTGDIQLTLAQKVAIDAALMVTTPQEVSVLDVKKAMRLFEQVNIPLLGVVENMSYFEPYGSGIKYYPFGKEGGKKLAKESGIPLLAELPIDSAISSSLDAGQSLFSLHGDTVKEMQNQFTQLATRVVDEMAVVKNPQALKNFELVWK